MKTLGTVVTDLGQEWHEGPGGRLIADCEHGAVALQTLEKRGPYRAEWAHLFGEADGHLMIIEEIEVRRMLRCTPFAFLLFRDQERPGWIVFSAVDLLCMPKRRVNRLGGGVWLADRRNGAAFAELEEAVRWALAPEREREFFTMTACYGSYQAEVVPEV